MKTYILESKYIKAMEWGTERNGRDPKGNLLVGSFVPESTPNQHNPTCDPSSAWFPALLMSCSMMQPFACSFVLTSTYSWTFWSRRTSQVPISCHFSWMCNMFSWCYAQKNLYSIRLQPSLKMS